MPLVFGLAAVNTMMLDRLVQFMIDMSNVMLAFLLRFRVRPRSRRE